MIRSGIVFDLPSGPWARGLEVERGDGGAGPRLGWDGEGWGGGGVGARSRWGGRGSPFPPPPLLLVREKSQGGDRHSSSFSPPSSSVVGFGHLPYQAWWSQGLGGGAWRGDRGGGTWSSDWGQAPVDQQLQDGAVGYPPPGSWLQRNRRGQKRRQTSNITLSILESSMTLITSQSIFSGGRVGWRPFSISIMLKIIARPK